MKKAFAAALLCSLVAAPAFAGPDSTDRWGEDGTGPMIWESPCGLADFQGNTPMPEKCRPPRDTDRHARTAQPASPSSTQGSSAR